MKARIASALLWFYAGWYAGALLAWFFGTSPLLGPILGTATAALMVGDPRRLIWKDRTVASTAPADAAAVPDGLPESA